MSELSYLSIYLNHAWKYVEQNMIIKKLYPHNLEKGKIKIVCISDTHGNDIIRLNIPNADILIHTGDITKFGTYKEIYDFNQQIGNLPHKYKIVIAGNHDIILDDDYYKKYLTNITYFNRRNKTPQQLLSNCIYLKDSFIEILGIKIYGSPYQPVFKNMAFNLDRGTELQNKWKEIPNDIDILLTHGPPFGYGDFSKYGNQHVGCIDLLDRIIRIKPKYHIFGHIHESYGIYSNDETIFINSASCNTENNFEHSHSPIVFYL